MNEITLRIQDLDRLVSAVDKLAEALRSAPVFGFPPDTEPLTVAELSPNLGWVTPTAETAAPAPMATLAPVAAPAPAITKEQLGKAGADLISQNRAALPGLMALLQKYGVQSVQQLPDAQIGAFATEMRGLGARI